MDIILPSEIELNIFSRLPVDSVLECKRVCKSWRNLLDDNHEHFSYLHLRHQHGLITNQHHHQPLKTTDSGMMNFIIFDRQRLYYAEYHGDEEKQVPYHTTRINLNFPENVNNSFVSSCNGLICLSDGTEHDAAIYYKGEFLRRSKPVYICNPITREIVTIPGLDIHEKNENGFKLVHGFGYHPSKNEYKVVRICYHSRSKNGRDDFLKGNVDVYTLGSGKGWRNIGQTEYFVVPNRNDRTGNNCVNGALHWFNYETEEIVAFDLADEEFHLVHEPPGLIDDDQSSSKIFVMNGCLCLGYDLDRDVDIWMLKKNDKEENAGTDNQYYNSWSWSKEFHIETTGGGVDKMVGLTKGDEVLFFQSGSLIQYNPRTTKITEMFCMQNFTNDREYDPRMISHAHSFVSLKATGEVNVETCIGSTDYDDELYYGFQDLA